MIARLTNPLASGGFKWCAYPCQRPDAEARECMVPVDPRYTTGAWAASGPTNAPTLSPSIDCRICGWHGFIVDGKAVAA